MRLCRNNHPVRPETPEERAKRYNFDHLPVELRLTARMVMQVADGPLLRYVCDTCGDSGRTTYKALIEDVIEVVPMKEET